MEKEKECALPYSKIIYYAINITKRKKLTQTTLTINVEGVEQIGLYAGRSVIIKIEQNKLII
ncbi:MULTISPECIES: hypothetical protein [unclassified Gilliamella]|uniref:hypothetical protein n=1 Tax=unclassified Gilliamella TaxID=2685620 RepID=UPI00226A7C04|nr:MULTISPECIES: hypothetical protein [unclassified Gilliamella]MCX8602640.1 hypothetical protein [Gilliamella sp. B3722]MCX8607229.1 hypothetical protein [Gilliamella sp. B3771]MCX8611870.1 hypothetical protein [Gilliamella sp. B3891]MCX8614318.1 hypothetical protein [Gilliamella sp. B3773]MCX8614379.1 hypothetical protein [Gilliamella sp. B3770]